MPTVYYGSKDEPGFELTQSDDLIAVRTRNGRSVLRSGLPVANDLSAELHGALIVATYPEASVEVYRVPVANGAKSLAARKSALKAAPEVRFAGGVLVDPKTNEPVVYTENLFIKFKDNAEPDACEAALRDAGLSIKSRVTYATNAYFVSAPEGSGQTVFDTAAAFLKREDVDYAHPELIRPRARKGIFPQQWHLKATAVGGAAVNAHANVDAAHAVARGAGITIAIIDDGVDIDHAEFAGKIVSPRDATEGTDDPRPKDPVFGNRIFEENHGTACAGVACAAGTGGASGVAPEAKLMPIRLSSGLGSQQEADAFVWAADHGADVISCSWGPEDGAWFDPDDPLHGGVVPIAPSARLAIDHAVNNGRNGKGCVVLFAAGNGNESVENDGYASYSKVVAVAACNDRNKRSVYSDFGAAVWCAFPSNDFGHPPTSHPAPLTRGIWTTDRSGQKGYNNGNPSKGDAAGNFTNAFGGTSSACPGAAGVAALILSVNPELKWHEVKDLMKRAVDRIDPQNGNYDANGHSAWYGFGRLNALAAVELAKPAPRNAVTVSQRFDAAIPDLQTVNFLLSVPEAAPVQALTAQIDIVHTYIGDLVVTLSPPSATGLAPIVLHNRAGGSNKNLAKTFDAAAVPALGGLAGLSCKGQWKLAISDMAAEDAGTLVSFGLTLNLAHQGGGVRSMRIAGPKPAGKRKRKQPVALAAAS